MVGPELSSAVLLFLAPAIVFIYNILRYSGLTRPEASEDLIKAWEHAIQEREIHPGDDGYEVLYELFVEKRGDEPDCSPDFLEIHSSGYGVASYVYCAYEVQDDDINRKSFVPLVLADKWVREQADEYEDRIGRIVLVLASFLLTLGFGLNIYILT